MLFHRPDDAESVNDLIGDEFGVLAADLRMVVIVIAGTALYKACQLRRELALVVTCDEVHHMIRNERRKPPYPFPRHREVVRDPDGRRGHHLNTRWIPARRLGPLAHEAQAPCDEMRVRKLEDHTIGDLAREM